MCASLTSHCAECFRIVCHSTFLGQSFQSICASLRLLKNVSSTRMRNSKPSNENSCCGLDWNVFMTSMDMTTKVRWLGRWPSSSLRSTISSSLSRMSWPSCICSTSSARSSTCTGKYEWNEPLFILLLYLLFRRNKQEDSRTTDKRLMCCINDKIEAAATLLRPPHHSLEEVPSLTVVGSWYIFWLPPSSSFCTQNTQVLHLLFSFLPSLCCHVSTTTAMMDSF